MTADSAIFTAFGDTIGAHMRPATHPTHWLHAGLEHLERMGVLGGGDGGNNEDGVGSSDLDEDFLLRATVRRV